MILFIISIVAILIGIRLTMRWRTEDFGFTLMLVFGFTLFIQTLMLTNHYFIKKSILKREAFRTTIDNARANGTKLENATILKDIAEWNQWIVNEQIDNEFWFDVYTPDCVDTLTLLK